MIKENIRGNTGGNIVNGGLVMEREIGSITKPNQKIIRFISIECVPTEVIGSQ